MSRKQHISSRIKELQQQWDLLNRKIAVLEREVIVETRKDEIFRMEQEVIRLKENLRPINKELTRLKMPYMFLLGFVLFVLSAGGIMYLYFPWRDGGGYTTVHPPDIPKPNPPSVNNDAATTKSAQKGAADNSAKTSAPEIKEHEILTDPITGMQFVHVTGGCFQMGSPDNEPGRSDYEVPRHKVCVNDFQMGKYEVTQGQWVKITGSNPSEFQNGDNYPVEKVSWNKIQEFIAELNRQSGREYRLPTEAEWEYAARAGTTASRYWGDDISCDRAMYGNSKDSGNDRCMEYTRSEEAQALTPYSTAPVGSYPPNQLGLYDMLGNVSEFCSNWLGFYPSAQLHNPQGPSGGEFRVFRGGSLNDSGAWLRSAVRYGLKPDDRDRGIGFRIVLPIE